jgi:glycosyltransferase involved in cell wall biosynthesis
MKSKTRLFLGGFVNASNAQNINCRSIAKHLNKFKFEIHTLSIYSSPDLEIDEVYIHKCYWPHRFFIYWVYLVQILLADIVYLPKGNHLNYTSFLCTLFNKKSMTTIEGIFDQEATKNATKISGKNFIKYYHRFSQRYSITSFMRAYNYKHHQLETNPEILYLGTESSLFLNVNRSQSELKKVIMIGNDLIRKGVFDYFKLASKFQDLEFHLVGSGNGKIDIEMELKKRKLSNLVFHGFLDQQKIAELLSNVQLHILLSRSEGFPKVILENACNGIPSLVYGDYGAQEWISNGVNGFVVSDLNEAIQTLVKLQTETSLLNTLSCNSIELGKSFDWTNKIKHWEKAFEDLHSS